MRTAMEVHVDEATGQASSAGGARRGRKRKRKEDKEAVEDEAGEPESATVSEEIPAKKVYIYKVGTLS